MKKVVTIVGIRPDFIRMAEIFRQLDENEQIDHTMIHTGQHFETQLSDIFFNDLSIREPDINLEAGAYGKHHYELTAEASVKAIRRIRKIKPDIVLFLGDSNSASLSLPIKRDGWKVGHIEAGMRTYNEWMPEEINRVCCDHMSSLLFTYHNEYSQNLIKENISPEKIHMVGNTIVEVCKPFANNLFKTKKTEDFILVDIHRAENLGSGFKEVPVNRLINILEYVNMTSKKWKLPAKMLGFGRTKKVIVDNNIDLGQIEVVDLMGYKDFLKAQYHCKFMISDSGTAQEEPAMLNTPVLVPRDYTERFQSLKYNCSAMLNANQPAEKMMKESEVFLEGWFSKEKPHSIEWLGEGNTSSMITDILLEKL